MINRTAAFFRPGMPGVVPVTAIPADGVPRALAGQWWRAAGRGAAEFVDLDRIDNRLQAPEADVTGIARGDTLIIAGAGYRVSAVEPDGHGVTTLICEPTGATNALTLAPQWRLRVTAPSWSTAYSGYKQALREIELYASDDATGANLSASASAITASSENLGYSAALAADADDAVESRWENTVADVAPWWSVTLPLAVPVRSIRLRPYYGFYGGYMASEFALESSTDGATWEHVATISTADSNAWQTFRSLQ